MPASVSPAWIYPQVSVFPGVASFPLSEFSKFCSLTRQTPIV